MSYVRKEGVDSLNQVITDAVACKQLCQHMVRTAKDFEVWKLWFHKAMLAHAAAVFRFIEENGEVFSDEEKRYAEQFRHKRGKSREDYFSPRMRG